MDENQQALYKTNTTKIFQLFAKKATDSLLDDRFKERRIRAINDLETEIKEQNPQFKISDFGVVGEYLSRYELTRYIDSFL